MYFKFFKPKNWKKRSDVRRRGFIQRFLKIFNQESHVLRTLASCERTMRRLMQNLTRLWRYKKLSKLFNRF